MWILPFFLFALTGAIAGLMAGLLGVGGGLVTVPAMNYIFYFLGFPADKTMLLAIGTSLGAMVFTSAASAWSHHTKKGIDVIAYKKLLPGVILGAVLGALIASSLPGTVLEMVFGVSISLISINFLIPQKTKFKEEKREASILLHFFAGLFIGASSTILGIGGGILTVPYLNFLNTPMRNAVSTSAALGFPISFVGASSFLFLGSHEHITRASYGYVYLPAFVLIAISSILFAPIGAWIAYAIPIPMLRRAFGAILLMVGLSMIF